jgi:hypothetical protein
MHPIYEFRIHSLLQKNLQGKNYVSKSSIVFVRILQSQEFKVESVQRQ